MHYALPAACGQMRHFNYCALVDGDVRREGAHTDPFYSPHLCELNPKGLRAAAVSEIGKRLKLSGASVRSLDPLQRRQEPFCVPVRTALRRGSRRL